MLSGLHFLLTYTCNFECDYCFLYCTPKSSGTFAREQIEEVLDEAVSAGTIEWIYFEGGPAELVRTYEIEHEDDYVDECHLCFLARRKLLDRFSEVLAPRQVYMVR